MATDRNDLPSADASSGELFAGKYRLVRRLGRGAMGEVWLAEEEGPRDFRRRVAVKKLLAASSSLGDYARRSFLAEAQVIARLDHPNVVRLIELGDDEEGSLYLVLDYVDGASLDRLVHKVPLSPPAVAYVGREIARALEAVHDLVDDEGRRLGVVHRDVSPSNILVARDARVRLTDFGVARISAISGERTEAGVFKGKLQYMPPEQARGEAFDGRADVFSLAVTLFEALHGARIRVAETQAQLILQVATDPVPRVRELCPDAPATLADAIDRATAIDPRDRFAGASELAARLDEVLRGLGPGAEQAARDELRARVAEVTGRKPLPESAPVRLVVAPEPKPAPAPAEPPPSSKKGVDATGVGPLGVPARSPSRAGLVAASLAALGLGAIAALFAARPRAPGPSTTPDATAIATAIVTASASATATATASVSAPAPMSATVSASASATVSASASATATDRPATGPRAAPAAGEDASSPGTLQIVVLPWADVTVDGKSAGTTPLAPIQLAPGTHSVILRNAELGVQRTVVAVVKPGKPTLLRVDLNRASP